MGMQRILYKMVDISVVLSIKSTKPVSCIHLQAFQADSKRFR